MKTLQAKGENGAWVGVVGTRETPQDITRLFHDKIIHTAEPVGGTGSGNE